MRYILLSMLFIKYDTWKYLSILFNIKSKMYHRFNFFININSRYFIVALLFLIFKLISI